jgi:hypothetical protein
VAPAYQLALQEQMALRSPFLHNDVIDLLTRLPMQQESLSTLLSHLVKNTTGELHAHELPLHLSISSLFQTTDTELWQQTLSPEALQGSGLFDATAVATLFQKKPKEQATRALVFIFTIQLLLQLFGIEV